MKKEMIVIGVEQRRGNSNVYPKVCYGIVFGLPTNRISINKSTLNKRILQGRSIKDYLVEEAPRAFELLKPRAIAYGHNFDHVFAYWDLTDSVQIRSQKELRELVDELAAYFRQQWCHPYLKLTGLIATPCCYGDDLEEAVTAWKNVA